MKKAITTLLLAFATACGGTDFTSNDLFVDAHHDAGPDAVASGGTAGSGGGSAGSVATGGKAGAAGSAGADAGSVDACTPTTIHVTGSVYAGNCGTPTPLNGIADACDGGSECTYAIDFHIDPGFDPSSGCPKDVKVDYQCRDGEGNVLATKQAYTPAEAYSVKLECGCL